MELLEALCLLVAVLLSLVASIRRNAWAAELVRRQHVRRQLEIMLVEHNWLQHRLHEAQMWVGQMNQDQAKALINNIMHELRELQRRFTAELAARQ